MKYRLKIIVLVISIVALMTNVYAATEQDMSYVPNHNEEFELQWDSVDLEGEYFIVEDEASQPAHNEVEEFLFLEEDDFEGEYYTVYQDYAPIVNETVKVQLDGKYVDFTDSNGNKVDPQIVNGRTMVPMRKIFEVFGTKVDWEGETKTVTAQKDDMQIILQIDNTEAKLIKAGEEPKTITLDSAPVIINDRTMVPVRFIAESLSKKVGWDSDNRTVIIIDTSFVEKAIQKDASHFYEFLNREYAEVDTYDMDLSSKAKMNASVSGEKADVEVAINANMKLSQTAFKIAGEATIKGDGDTLKQSLEQIPSKIDFDLVIDNENKAIYAKSALIEQADGKWVKFDLNEANDEKMKELIALLHYQGDVQYSVTDVVDALLQENTLNIHTYETLQTGVGLLTAIFSDDNFKVSRNGKETVYELEWNAGPIIDILSAGVQDEQLRDSLRSITLVLTMNTKIKEDIAQSSQVGLKLGGSISGNSIDLDASSKAVLKEYNQKIDIKIPAEKDTVSAEAIGLNDYMQQVYRLDSINNI